MGRPCAPGERSAEGEALPAGKAGLQPPGGARGRGLPGEPRPRPEGRGQVGPWRRACRVHREAQPGTGRARRKGQRVHERGGLPGTGPRAVPPLRTSQGQEGLFLCPSPELAAARRRAGSSLCPRHLTRARHTVKLTQACGISALGYQPGHQSRGGAQMTQRRAALTGFRRLSETDGHQLQVGGAGPVPLS